MHSTILINNKPTFVRGDHDFASVLEENIGADAADFYLGSIAEEIESHALKCTGECDHTYRIEEHYQRFLRDIQDEIAGWAINKLTKAEIEERRDKLYELIEKEL